MLTSAKAFPSFTFGLLTFVMNTKPSGILAIVVPPFALAAKVVLLRPSATVIAHHDVASRF
jgi:hypothetical protein